MASITLSSNTVIRPYRSSGTPVIRHFQESTCASTALIKVGQVVQFDEATATANYRIVKTDTGTVPNLSTAIVGISAEGSTSDGSATGLGSGRTLPVYLARPGQEFLFPSKMAGSAHGSSDLGRGAALGYDSTLNIHYIDPTNSTAGDTRLIITEVIDPGTTNGFYAAVFTSTAVTPMVWSR